MTHGEVKWGQLYFFNEIASTGFASLVMTEEIVEGATLFSRPRLLRPDKSGLAMTKEACPATVPTNY
jgi:hypothetical protein